jgi:hypothetical protein
MTTRGASIVNVATILILTATACTSSNQAPRAGGLRLTGEAARGPHLWTRWPPHRGIIESCWKTIEYASSK